MKNQHNSNITFVFICTKYPTKWWLCTQYTTYIYTILKTNSFGDNVICFCNVQIMIKFSHSHSYSFSYCRQPPPAAHKVIKTVIHGAIGDEKSVRHKIICFTVNTMTWTTMGEILSIGNIQSKSYKHIAEHTKPPTLLKIDSDRNIKHQSSGSLAFVRGIHRRLVNSPIKRPVTRNECFHFTAL